MKKIPTLFEREFENHKVVKVLPKFTNINCEHAFHFGIPTIKFDGSCCAIINGEFYKRYDAKKGKEIPKGAIKCQDEPDPITGHMPCWIKVDTNNPADKWFLSAFNFKHSLLIPNLKDGTYEAIGVHFQGNPYGLDFDTLIPHGSVIAHDFELYRSDSILDLHEYHLAMVRLYLETHNVEGLVFWDKSGTNPICKIKRSDFGFEWPIKEKANE